jgi:hypothetical protein
MTQILLSEEEVDRMGDALYEQLRSKVETEENIGKLISIDTETGDHEIAEDLLIAGKRLQARHPNAKMVGKRIGYNAVYTVGGALTRTSSQ